MPRCQTTLYRSFLCSVLPLFLSACTTLGTITIPTDTLTAKYTDEESEFINVDGMTIHYKDEGEGPVVILIHGVCSSLHTWDAWTEVLKKQFRVIRMDLPGFGFSQLNDPDVYTRQSAIRLTEEFARALDLDRVSLVGNSLGGYVAWLYASAHPDKVDKMILVDPVGQPMPMPGLLRFACNPLIRPFSKHMMPRFIFDTAVKQVYGDTSLISDEVKDRYFELAMRENGKRDYVSIFNCLKKESQDPHFNDGLEDIITPTLVMWGTRDIWIKFDTFFPQWQATLPHASFISYKGLGHVPMEEDPEKTVRDALDFLTKNQVASLATDKEQL